ncbi:MAG: hypothetical protein ACO1OO_00060 [Flavisolibacter sp.]
MLIKWYTQPNKISLAVFICIWLIAIVGFIQAMDYFRQPNYLGFMVTIGAGVQIFKLIKNYNSARTA